MSKKQWLNPELKNLSVGCTNEDVICSAEIATLDGTHSKKCHHNLPDMNASNCPWKSKDKNQCLYGIVATPGGELPDIGVDYVPGS